MYNIPLHITVKQKLKCTFPVEHKTLLIVKFASGGILTWVSRGNAANARLRLPSTKSG